MSGQLVYVVCDQDDVDPQSGTCAHVAYVQAPTMLPPLDTATGVTLTLPVIGLWYLAAAWRRM